MNRSARLKQKFNQGVTRSITSHYSPAPDFSVSYRIYGVIWLDDTLLVNWCEITTQIEDGKILYRNAFAASLVIDDGNVAEVVAPGRARRKIENENNNTMKTKGYHFGHGEQFLSSLLATLILLAFLLRTLLDLRDDKFCLLRQKLRSHRHLFDDMKALTTCFCFDSCERLFNFMLEGWSYTLESRIVHPPKPEIG